MSSPSVSTQAPVEAGAAGGLATPERPTRFADYVNLTKPRLSLLAAIVSAAGYYMGVQGPGSWGGVLTAFVGTFVMACGAMALNQYLERDTDALMLRTRRRPLPSGRVSPGAALVIGVVLAATGILHLAFGANLSAAAVGSLAVASYVMIYTPLKRVTSLNTIIGAVPGALPPVIGYAAAADAVDFRAVLLFAIMFLWQLPHFLAIAWVCRDDYARAGMSMLTVIDPEGGFTARQVVIYSLALLLISPMPSIIGMAGWIYGTVSVASGVIFLILGLRWYPRKDLAGAKKVFFASLLHVTLLFTLMVADKA